MAPEEDKDDILGAEYDRREFREMCELFGFDVTPPGTPEEPAAAPASFRSRSLSSSCASLKER